MEGFVARSCYCREKAVCSLRAVGTVREGRRDIMFVLISNDGPQCLGRGTFQVQVQVEWQTAERERVVCM